MHNKSKSMYEKEIVLMVGDNKKLKEIQNNL